MRFCLPTQVLGHKRPGPGFLEGPLLHALAASLIVQTSMQSLSMGCRWAKHNGPTTYPNMIRPVSMQEDVVAIRCATPDTQQGNLAHLLHRSQPGRCCNTTSRERGRSGWQTKDPSTTCHPKKNAASGSRSTRSRCKARMLLIGTQRRPRCFGDRHPQNYMSWVLGPPKSVIPLGLEPPLGHSQKAEKGTWTY